MATPFESAQLILQLYDLRREEKMRAARDWFWTFKPKSFDDVKHAIQSPDSAKFRMVLAYWELAATLVNHGAIDKGMFSDANGEHLGAYAKVEPFLPQLREMMGPQFLTQLQQLIDSDPKAKQMIALFRAKFG